MSVFRKALFSSAVTKYVMYLFQVVSLVVTARMFTPVEFGTLVIVLTCYQFILILSEAGLASAIISSTKITHKEKNAAFTFSLILACILTVIFLLLAKPVSQFYQNDIYVDYFIILSIAVFFSTATMVPAALLKRDCKFYHFGLMEIISELLSFCFLIAFYFEGFGVFSILFKYLLFSFFKFILIYYISKFTSIGRPSLTSQLKEVKVFMSFSLFQFAYSVVNYFSRNIDNIIIGKFFGVISLGIYDKSYQLMRYPMMMLSMAISPAIQAVLSNKKKSPKVFLFYVKNVITTLFVFSIPISLIMNLFSLEIITLILGEQWLESKIYIDIFSFAIPTLVIQGVSGSFFQALNRTKCLFYCGIGSLSINLTAIFLGVYFESLELLTILLVTSFYLTTFFTYFFLIRKGLGLNFIDSLIDVLIQLVIGMFLLSIFIYLNYIYQFSFLIRIVISSSFIILALYTVNQLISKRPFHE